MKNYNTRPTSSAIIAVMGGTLVCCVLSFMVWYIYDESTYSPRRDWLLSDIKETLITLGATDHTYFESDHDYWRFVRKINSDNGTRYCCLIKKSDRLGVSHMVIFLHLSGDSINSTILDGLVVATDSSLRKSYAKHFFAFDKYFEGKELAITDIDAMMESWVAERKGWPWTRIDVETEEGIRDKADREPDRR